MYCLLVYDISDDKERAKIADACLDYGLDRVQYSAFYGNISRNLQEELFQKVQDILDNKPGHIMLVPVCYKDWRDRLLHVQEPVIGDQ